MPGTQQRQEWPPKESASWQDLEYSGCFFCDRPWDHTVNPADATIFLCLDCYERRYGQGDAVDQDGQRPE